MSKVLVVDDSLTDRRVTTTYLEQAGLSVLDVESAEEAMEKLSQYQPNLIVLDVVMGGMSGFEFCQQLKKDRHTCSIPVIICSTKTTPADLILGEIIGVDAYLPKDVSEERFVKTAKRLVQKPAICNLL